MLHIVVNGLCVYHVWQQCWYFHFVNYVLESQKQKNISQSRHSYHKPYAHAYLKLNYVYLNVMFLEKLIIQMLKLKIITNSKFIVHQSRLCLLKQI